VKGERQAVGRFCLTDLRANLWVGVLCVARSRDTLHPSPFTLHGLHA
jgi:hypothetical protein